MMLAADLTALHAMSGNPDLFIDELGNKINGQWNSSNMNEHDILTGSKADGTTSGQTCMDWTSDAANGVGKTVGHSDGMGPNMNTAAPFNSWNAAHDTNGCADTAPGGGAGRIYCFAID
jgi:hypothetical protein